jgi:hypothetical protein
MRLTLICLMLGVSGFCQADVPKLLTERSFSSASLAEAANHFIVIGEQATFDELGTFLDENPAHTGYLFTRGYSVDERIAWVFRIIYEPKEPVLLHVAKTGARTPGNIVHLRGPDFGWLQIPKTSMPAENWPLYPIALSGSTYIVLKETYSPKDMPETIGHYMKYCKDHGVIRKTPVVVPTREQALEDMEQLRQSTAWKAIKWIDNGEIGFPTGEQRTWNFIQNQARAIPEPSVANSQTNVAGTQISTR